MELDWGRLGRLLAEARKAVGLSQPELGKKIGAKRATISNIETGKGFSRVTPTIRSFAVAVGWTSDSPERVLVGGDPEFASQPAGEAPDVADSEVQAGPVTLASLDLPSDLEYELREGKALGGMVLNLGPDERDGHLIVVVKGPKDSTPEDDERAVARWRKTRGRLQGMTVMPDEEADS